MKKRYAILTLCFVVQFGFTQTVDQSLIHFKDLNFYASKAEIIKVHGQPKDSYNPDYECGFLSGDYNTLDYGRLKFTGNTAEDYLIEEINLENDNSIEITYGTHSLTCETTIDELIKIFRFEVNADEEDLMNNTFIIPFEAPADDAILIQIKNGKLIAFGYWSPC